MMVALFPYLALIFGAKVFRAKTFGAKIKILFGLIALCLSGCDTEPSLNIKQNPLPYADKLESRNTDDLNMIVMHATELSDLKEAREYGERVLYENSGTGASGHYYIDRDGSIEQYVPDNRIANHTSGWNKKTLSIEMINLGRYPNWYHSDHQMMQEPYTEAQITALLKLLDHLKEKYPTITHIQGHEDLDTRLVPSENEPTIMVNRKMDPGEHFPWDRVLMHTKLQKETPEKE